MEIVPIIIILNLKSNKQKIINLIGNSLDNSLNNIVVELKKELYMDIDYPDDIDIFANSYWFDDNNDKDIFTYFIFHNNEWKTPWTCQEIYDEILELINKLDIQNSIIEAALELQELDQEEEIYGNQDIQVYDL
jgi:hypothetical protein